MIGTAARASASAQPAGALRPVHASAVLQDEKLNDLLSKFSDPTSPYYLAHGEVGPASPEDHTTARPLPGQEGVQYEPPRYVASVPLGQQPYRCPATDQDGADNFRVPTSKDKIPPPPHTDASYDRARATGQEWFDSNGFDEEGRLEWPCAWGESDMYR